MTPTGSYLERYEHGDHAAVWEDLRTLGDQIRQPPLFADALAVAHATMRRVRHNLERLIPRLQRLEYAFGAGFFADLSPAEAAEARRQAPVFAPPSPATPAQLAELENLVGPLPLSLRAFYEVVGSVNLVGRFPPGTFGPAQSEGQRQRQRPVRPSPETPFNPAFDYELDPLFVYSLELTLVLFRDWQDRRTRHGQPSLPYRLPIGPDCFFKYSMSGGGQYSVEVPCAAADAPLLLEWHQTTLVDYLRIALRWGGFPGLQRREPPILPPMIDALRGDLLPF
jgi:hypothetical protein